MKTAIVFTPKYLDHDTGPDHPESANRLKVILEELNRSGILESGECSLEKPKPASLEHVKLVHESDYIEFVQRTCAKGGGYLDAEGTIVSQESCKVAFLAVGGVLKTVDLVATRKFNNAFALVRPPGHHAGPYYALGFCIFNNIAIAAEYLLHNLNFNRILILDIDAHHGNGTQEIFYNTSKVLYMSLHQNPRDFPGTGYMNEIGEGEGLGYTVNIPFPKRIDNQIYHEAFDQIIVPIAQQYKPKFILVSAGFDAHYTDPVGELSLTIDGYVEVFSKILNLASKLCSGRLVAALEGGYNLQVLGRMATASIAKMANFSYSVQDFTPKMHPRARQRAKKIIRNVENILSAFWKL
jgi:acetoin utilization deacetylase AcuC-like enzyme